MSVRRAWWLCAALALAACEESAVDELDGGMIAPLDARVVAPDASDPPSCGTWIGRDPIRALFVGNSQIAFWDLPRLVSSLSESAPDACPRIEGEGYELGGANLRDLWEQPLLDGRRLPETITDGDYDVIVITESIDLAESLPGFPGLFEDYATRIVELSREVGATPILYATPYVERPDRSGFHAQADPQIALGDGLDVRVAAGGLAWLRVWEELPEIDLYFEDRQHPGFRGSYVSGLVLYAAITGASPIGLTRDPMTRCETVCDDIDESEADVFQRAAWAQHLDTIGP
ncbi:hypothetical protein [Sandaracinus amylolyticus]|uniref:hypothetical protein n=1 Tax=Sandaracinus amylolyticus TaxID=927083 RepID=UPI001F2A3A7A|nr:hypothetical protein [Sandaracinus amylolyticus]